jgi:hypothetical protein
MALLATDPDDLQKIINIAVARLRRSGLVVSASKSKVQVLGDTADGVPKLATTLGEGGEEIKQVDKETYMGSIITTDGCNEPQVKQCMGKANGIFWQIQSLLHPRMRLPAKLRGQLFSIYARSAATYDCQTWRKNPRIDGLINKTMHKLLTNMEGRGKHMDGDDTFRR